MTIINNMVEQIEKNNSPN